VREVLKKKVLVLGSTGLIGHQVFNYLQANGGYELHNISHRSKLKENTINIDARNEEHFLKCIVDIDPDFIINCIGILISDSNSNPENAIFLNAYLPHRLARIANDIDAQLIHISTDCVFSGNRGTPYIETDIKDGLGVYAETKMLGEIINKTHLTLRTSVVGPELKDGGEELFHWFMSQSGVISGYTKSIWSGVTTIELAKAVEFSIRNGMTGLYHVTNNASISKFDLIKLFQKHMRKDIDISPVDGRDTNKSFIDTRNILNYEIPSYDLMISEMAELVRNNKSLYSQYENK